MGSLIRRDFLLSCFFLISRMMAGSLAKEKGEYFSLKSEMDLTLANSQILAQLGGENYAISWTILKMSCKFETPSRERMIRRRRSGRKSILFTVYSARSMPDFMDKNEGVLCTQF